MPFFPRLHSLAACWPLVSDAAGRRLTQRPQPAEQGDHLLSPAGDAEEPVQVRESIVSFRPARSSKTPQTSSSDRGEDGPPGSVGGRSLGGIVLLGKGTSGRNDAGICSSAVGRSCASLPGAPFPVQGVSWRTSKCHAGEAIHRARAPPAAPPAPTRCLVRLGPGQTPLDAMRRGRPPKCLGRWGNCPLLAAFPPASGSRHLVQGARGPLSITSCSFFLTLGCRLQTQNPPSNGGPGICDLASQT